MTEQNIIEKINAVFAEEFERDVEEIVPEANLIETLDLDSLDFVDVVVLVDENFGVTLVKQDFEGVHTFKDFYDLIIRKVNEKQ